MRKLWFITLVMVLALGMAPAGVLAQPAGPAGQGGWYCPYMGGPGPGGWQGRGGWYCPWMRGAPAGPPVAQPGKPLSKDQAKALVEQYVHTNPNLKVGQVTDKNGIYEVNVVTKDGSLVDKIQVNRQTGWFRSAY
jgi:hypothetical protein